MSNSINDRIDIRISKEQKELLKFASDLSGFKSLSEFIIHCVNKEANKIIVENNQILKSIEDKKIFLETLLNPPMPNAELKKAFSNYNQFAANNESADKNTRKKIRQK